MRITVDGAPCDGKSVMHGVGWGKSRKRQIR